jgi:hypothetical protein
LITWGVPPTVIPIPGTPFLLVGGLLAFFALRRITSTTTKVPLGQP